MLRCSYFAVSSEATSSTSHLYEDIILDQNIQMRNNIEVFWFHSDRKSMEMPDRYACPCLHSGLAVYPLQGDKTGPIL
jgi:hypothetical protein